MQEQTQNDKMVPIDTSGEAVEVELKEDDKLKSNESEINVEQVEQAPIVETDDKKEELEDYSQSVKRRIDKLTRKMREAERREQAAIEYAKNVNDKYKTAVNTYSQVLKSTDAQIGMIGFQLQTELAATKKLPEIKQQDPIIQEKIKQLESGLSYIAQLKTAKTMAPSNVTGVELGYLVEKVRLIEENKKLDPAFRTKNNEKIEELDKLIAESRTVKFIKDAADKDVKVAENIRKSLNLGAEIEAFDTQEEMDARVAKLEGRKNPNEQIDTSAYGAIIPMADGTDVIMINKSAAIRDGRINTAAHELLHRYLKNTFKTEGDTIAAGKALDAYYESLGLDSDGEFEQRRKQYD